MFRTELNIEKASFLISLKSQVLSIGSCFADMVGERLEFNKVKTLSNPYGNIYNPGSLFNLLSSAIDNSVEEDYTFVENQGRWFNFDYHSELSANSKEELVFYIQTIKKRVAAFLKDTDVLILTFGTAFVYKLIENNKIVANCHKIPSKSFKKDLLSPKEIIDDFNDFYTKIKAYRPDINIILTVSPVRHIKDTLPLNHVSKSVLRAGIHYICQSFSNTSYFPSYEIMMDDLRDYRFYKEDMIHPTEVAENYIWEKFSGAYFSSDTLYFIEEWKKISKALTHKPFHPQSAAHQKFLKETLVKLEVLNNKVDLREEIQVLKKQII